MKTTAQTCSASHRRITFEPTFESWRRQARRLLADGMGPSRVLWEPVDMSLQTSLFASPVRPEGQTLSGRDPMRRNPTARTPVGMSQVEGKPKVQSGPRGTTDAERPGPPEGEPAQESRVPRRFLSLARKAACHRDDSRWALLYRLLWRLTWGGERNLLSVTVDRDVLALHDMVKAVRRDVHKMKAFVRFRRVEEGGQEWFIAWHRPDHLIVEAAAPFFVERFNDQRWSILTPDASCSWDLKVLSFGPGVPKGEAPEKDDLEGLWRDYYASIFNPARLNLKAMKAEMPVKHWATLPETTLLPQLIRDAPARQQAMLQAERRPAAWTFFPPAEDGQPAEGRLAVLAEAVQECWACRLCGLGTSAVFGEGAADARLMLVGEQPGDQEERRGRPFVGPAGQLLDEALEAAGLDRRELYLTNSVKHFRHEKRPDRRPGSRGVLRIHKTPGLTEVRSCKPWLEEELRLVQPRVVVCLGATAARALLPPEFRLRRDRGKVYRPKDEGTGPSALGTYHPAAILRQPDEVSRSALFEALVADLRRAGELISF